MDEGTPDRAAKRVRGREYERKYAETHRAEITERQRRRRIENPEEKREQDRRYREANKDKLKAYREANRERIAQQSRGYRAANRERILKRKRERAREYYQESRLDPQWVQKQRAAQERHRTVNRKRIRSLERLRKHGLTSEGWTTLWTAQDGLCYLCRRALDADDAVIEHDHRCCPQGTSCSVCRRGLACGGCNAVVGFADDDPERLLSIAGNLRRAMQAVAERMQAKPVQGALFGEGDSLDMAG